MDLFCRCIFLVLIPVYVGLLLWMKGKDEEVDLPNAETRLPFSASKQLDFDSS